MKIASYNSHRSAPFLRALVAKNNQVYSLEGSRRRYPISVPAGILRSQISLSAAHADGPPATAREVISLFAPPTIRDIANNIFFVRCRRGRRRYLGWMHLAVLR